MPQPSFFLLALLLIARFPQEQPKATDSAAIPPEAKLLVNPVKSTPEALARTRKTYAYDCAMCHGAKGDGKGELVADMKLTLKDYTDPAALKDITDGELFYVIKHGRGQMPGDGDRTKAENLWNMVILVRSFAVK